MNQPDRTLFVAVAWLLGFVAMLRPAVGGEVVLKDGRTLQGRLVPVQSLSNLPKAPAPDGVGPLRLILLFDDDLRRTFVSTFLKQEVRQDDPGQQNEKFNIRQRVLRTGREIRSVGPVVRIEPFDEFGRRIFTFKMPQGDLDVIQGITVLTPNKSPPT